MTLSSTERSDMRKALLTAGIKTRGMSDDDISTAHAGITPDLSTPAPGPVASAQPTPAPTPPTPAPVQGNDIAAAISAAIAAAMSGTTTGTNEAEVIKLIEQHTKPKAVTTTLNVTISHPNKSEPISVKGAHSEFPEVLRSLQCGYNAFLVGPPGSGKTTMGKMLAAALNTTFYYIGAVTDKYELYGFLDANGTYHETPFYKAIKNGGVFLMDEMDGSAANATLALNAAIENDLVLFPNGDYLEIDRSKTFIMGAGNTVGKGATREFVGRNPLDFAFLDRFRQHDIGYDHAVEVAIAKAEWLKQGGHKDDIHVAESWCTHVQEFRALLSARNIMALCTPRATKRGCGMLATGADIDKVKAIELYKHLSHDQRKQLGV